MHNITSHNITSNDTNKRQFVKVSNYIRLHFLKGNVIAQAVYTELLSFAWDKGKCWPSLKRMSDDIGISVRSVQRGVDFLQSKHLLTKHSGTGHRPTVYEIVTTLQTETKPVESGQRDMSGWSVSPLRVVTEATEVDTSNRNKNNKLFFNVSPTGTQKKDNKQSKKIPSLQFRLTDSEKQRYENEFEHLPLNDVLQRFRDYWASEKPHSQRFWQKMFAGWLGNYSETRKLARRKPHKATWLSRDTLALWGYTEDEAGEHCKQLQFAAAMLNKGYSAGKIHVKCDAIRD